MKIQVEITSKTNKRSEGNERKKIDNEKGITEQMKKWIEGAVAGIYSVVLPTESPMDIKKILFLIIPSVMFRKFIGKFWILHQNF